MMNSMHPDPLDEFPSPSSQAQPAPVAQSQPEPARQEQSEPTLFRRVALSLKQVGLGETALRIGTNILSVLVILGVVTLMQYLYRGAVQASTSELATAPAGEATPLASDLLPEAIPVVLEGIPRQADLHTSIPSRPRVEVVKYTVQAGDSVFGIAEKFGLKPSTILFGNYETLKDSPDLLKPDQVLNILPTDGTYYQWIGGGAESLTGVAEFFGADVEAVVNYPGNHLDPDALGDLTSPNISAGTWLIIPGGKREFTSWTAPMVIVNSPTSTQIWGPGACGTINQIQVGYGTFIWPAPKHWLSGTPYLPEIKHHAIDIAAQLGDAAFAADAGTTVYAGWNTWGYGNMIVLDHGNGWQSLYAHLDQVNVNCGQSVGQGEIIGLLGSTGNSTGPHLHFELMHTTYGKVNPLNFLPAP